MNLTQQYIFTVLGSDYNMLPQRSAVSEIVTDQLRAISGSMFIKEVRICTEPVIPFSFSQGLADCKEGRVVDMDTALHEEPPAL